MKVAIRLCAIYTGAVASLCLAVSLTWWTHPAFGHRTDDAVVALAFLSGLLCWFIWFGMVLAQGGPRSVLPDFLAIWKRPRFLLLWGWLALVAVVAVLQAGAGWKQAGEWGIDPDRSRPGCLWPLTADHDTKHTCVSHARYLSVNLATARIFVGFGTVFLLIDCMVFTTLTRRPRPTGKPAAPAATPKAPDGPVPRPVPFPYPSGWSSRRTDPGTGKIAR